MKIIFSGAARTVTGSKHILELENGKRILLDCGLFQGRGADTDKLNRNFDFEPASIDFLILSHAHIDHSGNIPNLIRKGFKGSIICTPATRDLCVIMLEDSAKIQESDAVYINKKRARRGLGPITPLYTLRDAEHAISRFVSLPCEKDFHIVKNVTLRFTEAGHILGSAAVNLTVTENENTTRICYTGDIGRPNDRILMGPAPFPQADYILCESTYGNRLHEKDDFAEEHLLQIVAETCVVKKGKLIIPAFSIDRTQEVIYALDRMKTKGILPDIKVYVDSPLSTNATNVMRMHPECFNDSMLEYMQQDPDPFGFNGLHYIQDVKESMALNYSKEPCIIISASGMMEAGRVKHHLKHAISDSKNTILIVGYCTPSSLGGRLLAGDAIVSIFGERFPVKANIEVLNSYSAHADCKEMINYLSCQDKAKVKKIFLVHGEYHVQQDFKASLMENGFKTVEIPEPGAVYQLD
jgi:metallo-beta-lactamase family protein